MSVFGNNPLGGLGLGGGPSPTFSSPSPLSPHGGPLSPTTMDPVTLMAIASIGSGLFNSILGNNQASQNRELSQEQLALQSALGVADRMGSSAGLAPAFERQRAALLHAMLGGMRPPTIQPPADIAPFAGNVKAAFQIPEGGFPKEMLQYLAPESLMHQESKYQDQLRRVDPHAAMPNLFSVGYPMPETDGRPNGVGVGPSGERRQARRRNLENF